MKPLVLCLVCHTAFAVSSPAEDPVSLGLRGAFSALSPIPDATSYTVRSTAAELLSRYVKTRNGSFFCEVKTGHTPRWSEMKSLQLARVSGTAVSQADQANGIAERYFVSVDCEMFRNYDGKAAKWSQWYNGRSVFMPPAIQVIRDPAGNWSASSSMLASLTPFSSKGDLAAIPHGPKPDSRPAMISAAALQPAGGLARAASPPLSSRLAMPPAEAVSKPSGADVTETILGICVFFAVCAVLIVAVIGTFMKWGSGKNVAKQRTANPPHRGVSPPPIRPRSPGLTPPPLPTQPHVPAADPIGLIQRKQTLMTAAEQAFFDVLEPLVRSSCRVSSNVRLADLFEVRHGAGRQTAFNRICSKHVDFVLSEHGSSRILCAIELDDKSHQRPDRIQRDDFVNELFAAQNLPLLRVPFAWTYNVPGLRAELLKAGLILPNAA